MCHMQYYVYICISVDFRDDTFLLWLLQISLYVYYINFKKTPVVADK